MSRAGRSRNKAGMTARADDGKNEKAPLAVYGKRGVNPAATYSPGSEDQVPSAIWGLTSVFGMGTGMTPTR